jgi:hypothetical protein
MAPEDRDWATPAALGEEEAEAAEEEAPAPVAEADEDPVTTPDVAVRVSLPHCCSRVEAREVSAMDPLAMIACW